MVFFSGKGEEISKTWSRRKREKDEERMQQMFLFARSDPTGTWNERRENPGGTC